jgi:hypothetical protein
VLSLLRACTALCTWCVGNPDKKFGWTAELRTETESFDTH